MKNQTRTQKSPRSASDGNSLLASDDVSTSRELGSLDLAVGAHLDVCAADVHVLSAAFVCLFSAYSAAQNLQSTVNTVRILSSQEFPSAPTHART